MYDVAEVLATLENGDDGLGAAFRPAFDINFLVHPRRGFRSTSAGGGEIEKVRGLVSGHRSGVAVSLAAMRRFLEAAPGVVEATVAPRALAGNEVRFHASVRTDRPTSRTELLEHYRRIQPWTTGTVIPDELSIVQPSFEAVAECAP